MRTDVKTRNIKEKMDLLNSKLTSMDRAKAMHASTMDQASIQTITEELEEALELIEIVIEGLSNKVLFDRYKIFKEDLDLYISDSMMLAGYTPEITLRATPKR